MSSQIRTAIVDDHPMIRDGVVQAFANERDIAVVGGGSTGPDAVDIARRLLPDVMLLDLKLPGGGFEAMTTICRQSPAVRVIILTASERDEDLATALKLGARGYLLKGGSAPEIVHAVRTVFGGSSYVTPALAARMLTKLSRRALLSNENGTAELTKREARIIALVARGMTNKEVADELNLSIKTVKHHMTNIMEKLQVKTRLAAALKVRSMEHSFEPSTLSPVYFE